MTKIKRWYTKIGVWTKIKYSLALLGAGSEGVLYLGDAPKGVMWVVFWATILGGLISVWFEDKDNDGIADVFEDDNAFDKRSINK